MFTPNEKLEDIDTPKAIKKAPNKRYVPASKQEPIATGRDIYEGPGKGYGKGYYGKGAGYYGDWGGRNGAGGTCWTNPYGQGCCDPAGNLRSATPPPPPPPPQFNSGCQCVPFQQAYNYNYAMVSQPYNAAGVTPAQRTVGINNVGPVGVPYPYASGRQVIVGGVTPNQPYNSYVDDVNQFGRSIASSVDPNDIVIMRTGVAVPNAHNGHRKTKRSDAMTREEIDRANDYLHRSVDEFRRRTRQSDLLSLDPHKSKVPYVHVLDVSHMTHKHPISQEGRKSGRDLEKAPNLYDHWNHLLYSNLRDIAVAEMARNSVLVKSRQQSAPPGSPYHNEIPLFP